MKKSLFPISLLLLIIVIVAMSFFGIKLFNTYIDYKTDLAEVMAIDAIAPAMLTVDYSWDKDFHAEENEEETLIVEENIFASYQYENILFVSYSEAWGEANLEALCTELLSNVHGREIDFLERVEVKAEKDSKIAGIQQSNNTVINIPLNLHGTLPQDFDIDISNPTSTIVLHNGDEYTTVQKMARTLSHEYGHHFTKYYFTLYSEELLESDYYKLRFDNNENIRTDVSSIKNKFDDYLENHMWYLVEIAAEDYMYLMGSPNTKSIKDYYDSKELLKMDIRDDKKLETYYDFQDTFNRSPHENMVLKLPDTIDGLADLFFNAIDMQAPDYIDRTEQAKGIEIKISRRTDEGHKYYNITWNMPWTQEDVIYTLVAYDENDNNIGAIKTVDSKDDAKAVIGSPVIRSDNYIYWLAGDYWTEFDMLRFRVVVTFQDGTAVISPPVDKEF